MASESCSDTLAWTSSTPASSSVTGLGEIPGEVDVGRNPSSLPTLNSDTGEEDMDSGILFAGASQTTWKMERACRGAELEGGVRGWHLRTRALLMLWPPQM